MSNLPLIECLYNQYKKDTGLQLFIEAISAYTGFPINSTVDILVGKKVQEMTISRMRSFFDELNSGEIVLDKSIIEDNDFLHSYFSVLNYAVRAKSDEKSKRFAKIIKKLYNNKINTNEFEDYTAIFNELSDREFIILCIKFSFEIEIKKSSPTFEDYDPIDPYPKTNSYWNKFVSEVDKTLGIDENELSNILMRIQRTGCYKIHFGHYIGKESIGDTTILFQKIYEIVKY